MIWRRKMSTRSIGTIMNLEAALYRLTTWLSPAYPIGSFSYSHGLEYAVEARLVSDAASLQQWVETILSLGAGRSDAALFAAGYRAAAAADDAALDEIAELASAWRGSREMALESAAQGTAFLAATRAAWPQPRFDAFAQRHKDAALPIAVAVACACHDVALAIALPAYLHAVAANLVSAGVRLIPLGQSDGQRVIAALESSVATAAHAGQVAALDQTGTAAPLIDWCSMRHETQYTRLFRS
jgi:urease accessory protein